MQTANAFIQTVEVTPDMELTPAVWAVRQGIKLLDADGWDIDGKSLDDPITEAEFNYRAATCTILMPRRTP